MRFFELLQVAIGNRSELTQTPTAMEWGELYALAKKQSLEGITYRGIEQLPKMQRPPKALLIQWYMDTELIKGVNAALDGKSLDVANKFLKDGFRSLILKGQGIAKLYKLRNDRDKCCSESDSDSKHTAYCSISEYRTSGDIDIWLEGNRKTILRYVSQHVKKCSPVFHHVDYPASGDIEIEVHFTPSWMNSLFTNHKLQRFFNENNQWPINDHQQEPTSYSEIPTPSIALNRVYILVHIYRHLFHEGIGLRQLLDYYFVLQQGFTEEERKETMRTLCALRMKRFTGAMMWVLQEVFGMDKRYLLTTPDEREGRFLLNEIMLAGNFGKYDERLQQEGGESEFRWAIRKVKRNLRFVRSYPSEVLWSPIFKLWHYFWRAYYRRWTEKIQVKCK